jgi:hypothetical protein
MEAKLEVLQEHEKLNEKQKQIEESFAINIEEYKNKILCIQCGKESEKIKCIECSKENIHKRKSYLLFSGSWVISSIALFSTLDIISSIPIGFCCATVVNELYTKFL